jgi:prolyl-tRNA synthetase
MRTRLFLRTAEFLWQEGHTAHETQDEAVEETRKMLEVYADFAENVLALPVMKGTKTESERFPGAVDTYCIEALMQDGKALQAGTSHYLGQNFSKAFDIKFLGRDQQQQFAHTTSWGVSTRLIGAMIMAHSDDEGLILPPRVAQHVAAIVPIFKTDEDKQLVLGFIEQLVTALCGSCPKLDGQNNVFAFFNRVTGQKVVVDLRDARPGDKQYHWEQRGVPFRIEVGPRDVQANAFVLKHRLDRVKETCQLADVSAEWLQAKLDELHASLFERARAFRESSTRDVLTYDELKTTISGSGGFVRCYFEPSVEAEAKIKEETKATVRLVLLEPAADEGTCVYSGKPTRTQVLFAQSY